VSPILNDKKKTNCTEFEISDNVGKLPARIRQSLLACYVSKLTTEIEQDLHLVFVFCCQSTDITYRQALLTNPELYGTDG
jgi:hypothetical protein